MKTNKKNKNKQLGFSLIELMLALAVISVGLLSVIDYASKNAEKNRAEIAGEQFAEIGKGLSNYISREAGNLTACLNTGTSIVIPFYALTQTSGSTVVGTCDLNHKQFLSPSTSQTNIFGTGYEISIQKTTSNSLAGLVLSSSPIRDPAYPASPIRYDWIGSAMKKAGASSGMTFTGSPNSMKGLGGGWELTSTDFPSINQVGLLGYRVGYQGNYDDIYLRLDGTYPMQGSLNMGNYSINNATDINFNGWLNGNNALLNNLKTGYISNAGNIQTDTLNSVRDITSGRDILASRDILTTNGNITAETDGTATTGNITAGRRLTSGEYVEIRGIAPINGYCESNNLISKSNTGEILTCINHAWTPVGAGGVTTFYEIGTWNRALAGRCLAANVTTGNCSCPSGTRQSMLVGFIYHNQEWDGTVVACIP